LSFVALVALHIAPGGLGALAYVALAGTIEAAGYPPLAALLVAIALAILPIELAILGVARSRARATNEPLVPFREPLPARSWAWLVPVLLIAAVLASGLRTADIKSEGSTAISTTQMGEAILKELQALHR